MSKYCFLITGWSNMIKKKVKSARLKMTMMKTIRKRYQFHIISSWSREMLHSVWFVIYWCHDISYPLGQGKCYILYVLWPIDVIIYHILLVKGNVTFCMFCDLLMSQYIVSSWSREMWHLYVLWSIDVTIYCILLVKGNVISLCFVIYWCHYIVSSWSREMLHSVCFVIYWCHNILYPLGQGKCYILYVLWSMMSQYIVSSWSREMWHLYVLWSIDVTIYCILLVTGNVTFCMFCGLLMSQYIVSSWSREMLHSVCFVVSWCHNILHPLGQGKCYILYVLWSIVIIYCILFG